MSRRQVFTLLYAASGAAALVYEVAWTRLLTLNLGHTVAAASTVLAAFMGGLALGAWLVPAPLTSSPQSKPAPQNRPAPPVEITAALPVIPGARFNLTDFGAVGDGKTLNTAAFEKAIAAIAERTETSRHAELRARPT